MDFQGSLTPILRGDRAFKIISQSENGKVIAKCQLCPDGKGLISGIRTSSSNFLLHYKRLHKDSDLIEGNSNKKRSSEVLNSDVTPFTLSAKKKTPSISKEKVDERVLNYIIKQMRPLMTVDTPEFRDLLDEASGGTYKPMCRQTLAKRITQKRDERFSTVKTDLETVQFVCTTADIWSSNNKSYMGVTCHYLEKDFSRKSLLLACRRMKFSHTHLEIASTLSDIHRTYGLQDNTNTKIVGTTTDNASNFVKAFKVFHHDTDDMESSTLEIASDFEDENIDESEISCVDIDFNKIKKSLEDIDEEINLPVQFRCCAHTLNLVASTDALKAVNISSQYKKLHRSTFAKLVSVWNSVSRSTKSADNVERICSARLVVPVPTRWNSTYDAVMKILKVKNHLPEIFNALNLPKLKSTELEFLEEYVKVMEPLASSIDLLQGDHVYLGYVLPTLLKIKSSLGNLRSLLYCEPLRDQIVLGINTRFVNVFDVHNRLSKPYILSTVTIPKFKLKWTKLMEQDIISAVKQLLVDEVANNLSEEENVSNPVPTTPVDKDGDFFNFLKDEDENGISANSGERQIEILEYLENSSSSNEILRKYPNVMKTFYKYNTIIPSSAPVERIFCSGGQILTPRRNKLSDDMFETLIFLKNN